MKARKSKDNPQPDKPTVREPDRLRRWKLESGPPPVNFTRVSGRENLAKLVPHRNLPVVYVVCSLGSEKPVPCIDILERIGKSVETQEGCRKRLLMLDSILDRLDA